MSTILRHRLTHRVLERRDQESSGERAVLATRGVAAAEPYLTRYLPALVLAAVLPPLTWSRSRRQDLMSAVIVLATLPLIPIFGALVGLATRDRAEEQWRAMAVAVRALRRRRARPADAGGPPPRHEPSRRRIPRSPTATDARPSRTLRVAFASSAVLELVATLSVALVAVTIGVRLASGQSSWRPH